MQAQLDERNGSTAVVLPAGAERIVLLDFRASRFVNDLDADLGKWSGLLEKVVGE